MPTLYKNHTNKRTKGIAQKASWFLKEGDTHVKTSPKAQGNKEKEEMMAKCGYRLVSYEDWGHKHALKQVVIRLSNLRIVNIQIA